MIDIAKELLIKNPEIEKIQDILYYFFRYYHINEKQKIVRYLDMYDYYNLTHPPDDWLETCVKNNVLF